MEKPQPKKKLLLRLLDRGDEWHELTTDHHYHLHRLLDDRGRDRHIQRHTTYRTGSEEGFGYTTGNLCK